MERDPQLEDILQEFAPLTGQPAQPEEIPAPEVPESPKEEAPVPEKEPEEAPAPPASAPEEAPQDRKSAKKERPRQEKKPARPEKAPKGEKEPETGRSNVIDFPQEDKSVTARIGRLIEKGDRYAQGMFRGDAPEDPELERRERLLPGVDWESEPTHAPVPRRTRQRRRPKPDTPPGKLAQRYKKGMGFLHTRTFLALLWCIPQLYLMLHQGLGLPLPAVLAADPILYCRVCAGGMAVSALLAYDVMGWGALCLCRLRLESETLLLLAAVAAGTDALTVGILASRARATAPYCGVVSLCLFFALWGRLLKRRGLWQSCRAAAGAAEPYLVTLDEKLWDGKDSFTKWAGTVEGYGSQIQDTDAVQRTYHLAAPLIFIFAVIFSTLASVGQRRPGLFFWCLSATLTAGCGLTVFLSFSMPYASLSRRLAKLGAALGGWDGIGWKGRDRGVILTDTDLFPPGSVTLNGIKLIGGLTLETAAAYTATLIRETGSGLEKPFSDMLRAKGGLYRRVSKVVLHEGGVTGVISGQSVYVGSGAFMELMGVVTPQGLNVKTAVFCAVDGKLSAIFALNYTLHPAVRPAIDSLIANGLDPILATRDFLVIPDMLRQRFKLPVGKVEFPSLDRRRELSSKRQAHERILTAVLCREGLGPYAEAVVGSKRLLSATRTGLFFDLLGSAVGLLLSFYLSLSQAFTSLSPGTMLAFLLLWLVPASLIAGWVNQY